MFNVLTKNMCKIYNVFDNISNISKFIKNQTITNILLTDSERNGCLFFAEI